MANKQANIYNVPLVAELNMDEFDGDIKQFSGFNKNNSPYVGKCLSNLYKKESSSDKYNNSTVVDNNGDIWSCDRYGILYKNTNLVINLSGKKAFVKKDITNTRNYLAASSELSPIGSIPKDCVYRDGDEIVFSVNFFGSSRSFDCIGDYPASCERVGDVVLFTYGSRICFFYNNHSVYDNFTGTLQDPRHSSTPVSYARDSSGNWWVLISDSDKQGLYKFNATGTLLKNSSYVVPYDGDNTPDFSDNTVDKMSVNEIGLCCPAVWNKEGELKARGIVSFDALSYGLVNGHYCWKYNPSCSGISEDFPEFQQGAVDSVAVTADIQRSINNTVTKIKVTAINNTENTKKFGYWYVGAYDWVYGYLPQTASRNSFCLLDIPLNSLAYKKTINNNFAGFSLLYNNGVLSGISYNGVLLTEWNSIDDSFKISISGDSLIYKDVNGSVYQITAENVAENNVKLTVYDNKVFTNVDGIFIDINNGFHRYCTDYNGRLPYFVSAYAILSTEFKSTYIAAGVNANYTDGKSQVISMLPNPIAVKKPDVKLSEKLGYWVSQEVADVIDVYTGKTSALYEFSFSNNVNSSGAIQKFFEPSKESLEYPVDTNGNVILTPSIFAEFIESHLNLDLVKEGTDSFQLLTYNNKKVFGYYYLSLLENVQNVFVIQGQAYALIDNLIYAYDVQNGVASTNQPILNVQDLKFLAASPYKAYFYSSLARSVFSFTGSNVLNLEFSTTKVQEVVDSLYNPDTLSVVFSSDKELIFITQFGRFSLEKPSNTLDEKLFVTKRGLAIVYPTLGKVHFIRYSKTIPEDSTQFEKQMIEVATCFYGVSETQVSINDTLYLRLFDTETSEGDVEISAETITEVGRKTETTTFHIKPADWDTITKSITLRYQPKTQRGLGTSFKIKTPFCIASMGVSNTVDNKVTDIVSKSATISPERETNNIEW